MNAADIAELRRLLAAATPGPWIAGESDWEVDAVSFTEHGDDCVEDCTGLHNGMIVECGRDYDLGTKNDRDLIVAAINALPGLLDELERPEALQIDAFNETLASRDAYIAKLQDELAKLRNPGHTCGVLGPCDGGCR